MLSVGITGGIGSGKSIVCEVFRIMKIPVYVADERARSLMETYGPLREKLRKILGEDVFKPDGKPNRAAIASRVFNDAHLLDKLNAAVHPVVMEEFRKWSDARQEAPYVLLESAILLESGLRKDVDVLIMVEAPEPLRVERIRKRDNRNEEEIKSIMARQWSSGQKSPLIDYHIINDDKEAVIPQILRIDNLLRRKSESNHTG